MTRPGFILAVGMAAALLPGAAQAQAGGHAQPAAVLIGGILVIIGFLLALASLIARLQTERRARRAERARRLYESIAESSEDGFLLINPDNRIRMSDRLREWLNFATFPERLADLAPDEAQGAGFDAEGYAALGQMVQQLRHGLTPPPRDLCDRQGKCCLKARAQGLTPADGQAPLIVCWFTDVTKTTDAVAGLKTEISGLQRSYDIMRALVDHAPLPIWLRDRELNTETVNRAYVEAVDAPDADTVLQNAIQLVPRAADALHQEMARRAMQTGEAQRHQQNIVVKGERRTLEIIDVPVDGNKRVASFALDVTEAEAARSDLARFTGAQAETLNTLSTPVAIFSLEKQLIYYNSAFVELTQLEPEYLMARPHHSELLEKMREKRRVPEQANFPAWKKAILDQYTTLLSPHEDMWHLADDTTWRVVTQPHPMGGLLVLFEDVSDKLALMRSHDTLIKVQQATLNNLREAVAVFGADGHLQLSNAGFARLWQIEDGYLAERPHINDIVHHCGSLLISPEDGGVLAETVKASTIARKQSHDRIALSDDRMIDVASVPLPDGAALLTCSDVTDSFRIETALRDRNEALETADRLKSEFVANMSYELRTPLTSIIGFSEMLDNEYFGALNDKQKSYIKNILNSSEKLQLLINDILDLAVTEAGVIALDKTDVSVANLVDSTVALTHEAARSKGLSLSTDVAKDCGYIQGDERRLKQVLYNLVTNAIHFTEAAGSIKIAARRKDNMVELEVSDTGIGIMEDDRDKVFERFHRGMNATQTKGAGLGLALVRSFIELHGGSVALTSKVGVGTTVVCRLPSADRSKAKAPVRLKRK